MHEFAYIGQGVYSCRQCGQTTTKDLHAEAIKTSCPNAPVTDKLLQLAQSNDIEVQQLLARMAAAEAVAAAMEARIKALEGV